MRIIDKLKKLFQILFKVHKKKSINNEMMFEKINFLISEIEAIKDEKSSFLLEYAVITLQNDNEQLLYSYKNRLEKNKNISVEITHGENTLSIILS